MGHSKFNYTGVYVVYNIQIMFSAPSLHALSKMMDINYNTLFKIEKMNGKFVKNARIPVKIFKTPKDNNFNFTPTKCLIWKDCDGNNRIVPLQF